MAQVINNNQKEGDWNLLIVKGDVVNLMTGLSKSTAIEVIRRTDYKSVWNWDEIIQNRAKSIVYTQEELRKLSKSPTWTSGPNVSVSSWKNNSDEEITSIDINPQPVDYDRRLQSQIDYLIGKKNREANIKG